MGKIQDMLCEISFSDFASVLGVFGTIVTIIGFAVGCFFAVLAVEAYGHVKDIKGIKLSAEKASESAKNSLKSITEHENRIKENELKIQSMKRDICTEMDEFFNVHIGLCADVPYSATENIIRLRDNLYRRRSLQAIKNAGIINNNLLHSRILEMNQYGKQEDLDALENILSSGCAGEETRVLIEEVKASIRRNGK